MRLEYDEERNVAYLHLVEPAVVAARVAVEDELPGEEWGVTLAFDREERLVGVAFSDARRRLAEPLLTTGAGLRVEGPSLDERPSYLALAPPRKGMVAETLAFGAAATRLAWGINLDVDKRGRVVGIEFE